MKTSIFFFKQKTAYEMRISDWSSDVCSTDLFGQTVMTCHPCGVDNASAPHVLEALMHHFGRAACDAVLDGYIPQAAREPDEDGVISVQQRSEERRVGKEGVRECRSP